MSDLKGKIAVVTGAGGILCRVMAETLLEEGAIVALLDIRKEAVETLAEALDEKGFSRTLPLECDVLDVDSIRKAHDAIRGDLGRVDILINGAGGNDPKATTTAEQVLDDTPLDDTFFELDLDAFSQVNDLNFKGTLLPTHQFARDMLEGGGIVINISSMSAWQPMTKVAAYSAAKASINNLTYWLAVHLGKTGIRVNAIAPGFFSTEQNRYLLYEKDGTTLTPRGKKILDNTPMGRFGEPRDLKGAVRFLTSDEAAFITGITLPVDGGFMAYSGV